MPPLSGTKERDGAYAANKYDKDAYNAGRRKSECRHLRSLRSVRRVNVHQGCDENPDDAAEEAAAAYLKGRTLADEIAALAALTVDDANELLRTALREENRAYVQIDPAE